MKERAKQLIKHPLITGSIIIFSGSLLGNFLNFIFNFFMLKYLTKVDYGTLQSLFSILTLPTVAAGAIIPMIVSFGGEFFAQNDLRKARGLYLQVGRYFLFLGVLAMFLFLVFTNQIAQFFHIDKPVLLILTYICIFISFVTVVNTAFLQAKLAFNYLTFLLTFGSLIKLILGVVFILLGFAVGGAIGALLASSFVAYLISFFPIRFVFDKKIKPQRVNIKELIAYGIPSALAILGLNALITIDILLAKHFFPPDLAGEYAGLSLIGRVIYLFTAPIGLVMFPLIVQKFSRKESVVGTFQLSILVVLIPSALLTLFYFLFPEFVIQFFSKREYLSIAQYLGFFAMFITMYSVATLLVGFYLAIKKTKIYIMTLLTAIAQAVLIWIYHDSIFSIITISFILTFVLVIILLLYYPYATKKR